MILWKLGLGHAILIYCAVSLFGPLYGMLSLITLHTLLRLILPRYGLEFARGNDIVHMYDLKHNPHNVVLFWEMDKIDFETLKNDGFGSIFKKLRKFRQVPTNILGFWFWKDVDVKLAFDQVQKYEMDIHSEEQILEYCDKLINYKIPVDRPQWMLKHIENYQPGKSACIFMYQHCFTDGVGLVNSLLFFNNDDQHRPKKAPGSGRGVPWYYYLIYSLLMPY